jgi:hypothetical protein
MHVPKTTIPSQNARSLPVWYIAPTHAVSKSPIKQATIPPTYHTEGSRSAGRPTPAKSTRAIANLVVVRKRFISSPRKKMLPRRLVDSATSDIDPGRDARL